MTRLPASLSIALWIVGSIWLVAILALLFSAPPEIVYVTLALGLIAGIAEWVVFGEGEH